jgi:hypothetical protein
MGWSAGDEKGDYGSIGAAAWYLAIAEHVYRIE